jgi:hypothetical protein
MSSPIFESLEMPLEVPALTAGAKCKKSKSGHRRVRNRDTGKCRLPCPSYCRPPLSDEEKAQRKYEKLLKKRENVQEEIQKIDQEISQLPPGAGGGSPAGAAGGYYQFSGGEIEGGEIEGGAKSKRKMTKYNMFVKKYAASHRNMSGKSLIKSAAKSWNKCKRSGSRSCSPRRR